MYKNDDELHEDLFGSRPASTRKLPYTGRLSLNRKLLEKRATDKPTIDTQSKSTDLPSNREPKNCSQNLQGSCGKNERTILTTCHELSEYSILFEQNQTGKLDQKTLAFVNDANNIPETFHGDSEKSNNLSSGFTPFSVKESKTMSPNNANIPHSHILKIDCGSIDSSLPLSPDSGNINSYLLVGKGNCPKLKSISHRALVVDKPTTSSINGAQKSGTSAIKLNSANRQGMQAQCLLGENECAVPRGKCLSPHTDNENGKGKRRCLLAAVDEPVMSSFSPSVMKQVDQKVSSSLNVSHLVTESFDNFETLEFQRNISDGMFLLLDVKEEVCNLRNKSIKKLCDQNSKDSLLSHCYVHIVGQSEVGGFDDCITLDSEEIWNKLPIEKSPTLPNCGKDKLQVQHHTARFLTGVANATIDTSAAEKKSANKKAWEGMMSMMRSSAKANQAKKPIKSASAPVKVPAQNWQSKPVGGDFSNTATASTTSKRSRWNSNGDRPCPFYKKIPGTGFAVDAFNYGSIPGVTSYFLSHFHSDHYIGLKASFVSPIYCTFITASLVQSNIRVKSQFLHILPLNQAQEIEDVLVTALDANQHSQARWLGDTR